MATKRGDARAVTTTFVAVASTLVAVAAAGAPAPAAPGEANPCTNGSFERLPPSGFPVDWGPVGRFVGVCNDARTGRRSLRLLRRADTKTSETGLNRCWRGGSGQRGAMIDRLRGGIDFWYKAVSADGAKLTVCAIPMTSDPIERTGSARATYEVPGDHIGDGRWHHARLRYDFTRNGKVRWVHFAARIVGRAGELLLDDVSYVPRVGVILRFGRAELVEDAERPGRRAQLRARLINAGDAPARDVGVRLSLPEGLTAKPAEARLPTLALDDYTRVVWTIDGERSSAGAIGLTATAAKAGPAEASLAFAPRLVIESFGPVAPLVVGKGPVGVECVLRNPGAATVRDAVARFASEQGRDAVEARAASIPPGRSVVLKAALRTPPAPGDAGVSVAVRAGNVADRPPARASVTRVADARIPPPSGRLRAAATERLAVLENDRVRLVVRRGARGFSPGEVQVRTAAGWQVAAQLPRLSRVIYRPKGLPLRNVPAVACVQPPLAENGPPARLTFTCPIGMGQPAAGVELVARFELAAGERTIRAGYTLTPGGPGELLAFDGPVLHALDRDEAVFPGLEWLVGEEVSSGALDIAEDHEHRVRHVVHPNMVTVPAIGVHGRCGTVGLLWDVHQKWDGRRDRPPVAFASPDRWDHRRTHRMGLFLPGVPEFVDVNARLAARPYPLQAGKALHLRCRLFADGRAHDALAPIDEYLRLFGLPKPPPLPAGSWDAEIAFSMRGYIESLWDANSRQWYVSKGGPAVMSHLARPRQFVADLLLGEMVPGDAGLRRRCRARADEVLAAIGGEARYVAQRRPGRLEQSVANAGAAAGLLSSRRDDGTWRYDADRRGRGVFEGVDYAELGAHGASAVGLTARNAWGVLRYARVAGDGHAFELMKPTLAAMEAFRVPRAAQVWEVPVHTPDILAAADAVDAYVEAYRFSGERRWLRDAVTWARRGLPFVYVWDDPDQPFLLGASIPVFGATWYRGSWFGRPVQWNGLRYANALLTLSEHDRSYPWRRIAELLIHSAVHQQDRDGPNAALWPDNISAIDAAKCPWVFAPRQILRNILKLTGRDEDLATVIVGKQPRRLHVSAAGAIRDAAWDGKRLTFDVTFPKGMAGRVLVSNVARPSGVWVGDRRLPQRRNLEAGAAAGWRYDEARAFLTVRVAGDDRSAVRVEQAAFRLIERLPLLATKIDFGFDGSAAGWLAQHDVVGLTVRDGALCGRIVGGDPYVVRGHLRVRGDHCPVVRVRLRVTAGTAGQFYWTTAASPAFAEDKVLPFALPADGRYHEVRLPTGEHRLWAGQTITALRIDPGNGARAGEFAVDYVRGAKE